MGVTELEPRAEHLRDGRAPPTIMGGTRGEGAGRLYETGKVAAMRRIGLLVLLALGGLPSVSAACSVPVFRYALERWKPAAYEAHVFYRTRLSDDDRRLVQQLEDGAAKANLRVQCIDL